MDDPNREPTQPTLSLAARAGWAALIIVTLYVCYFSHLGALGFVGPDEPRYAWVAREMVESGDWVTPRLYGKPWFEKPVLYYWGAALSFKLFGVGEASARLPSAISALLATLAMAWLAWRIYGAETARWLLLLLPTTVGMIGFSHAAAMDMPFTGMLTIAMVAAVALGLTRTAQDSSPAPTPWLALISFGVFLGAAALAKGPAALVLCGGTVFFWALFTRRWRDAFRLLHPAAIASFCATALPWYILCARRNPDFFRVFIIEHNFQRYLTPEFRHVQPFWYYAPILIIGASPWLPIAFGRLLQPQDGWPTDPSVSSVRAFIWSWVLFPVFFFTLSKSKLPGYILPCLLPVAFLVAQSLAHLLRRNGRSSRRVTISYGILFLALGIVWMFVEHRVPGGVDIVPAPWQSRMTLLFFSGGLLVTILALFKKQFAAMVAAVLIMLLLLLDAQSALPWVDPIYSARRGPQTARELDANFSEQQACVFRLQRGLHYGLNFYLHQELAECPTDMGQYKWVFTAYREVHALEERGFHCPQYLIFPTVVTCAVRTEPANGSQGKSPHGKQQP
jgi:4-amino-4-deoxy-L-arabinose transferase-like glycosyltransferase